VTDPRRRPVPSLGGPDNLQVEVTSSCNLKCVMCPLTLGTTLSGQNPGHMKEMVWEEVLRVARLVKSVCLVGYGEPTLNPRCASMLRDLDRIGVRFSFTTNAYSLRRDFVEQLAQLRNLIQVNVSIDSPDPDVYREIRKGELARVWEGLKLLTGTLPKRVVVAVSTVVMASNVRTLTAFPRLLREAGVKYFELGGMYDLTASLADQQVSDEEFGVHIARLEEECREYGIQIHCDLSLDEFKATQDLYLGNVGAPGHQTKQCLLPWLFPYVDKNGDVFPCCYAAGDRTAVMGNITQEPMEAVWEGERFRQFRTDLLGGTTMPGICHACTKPTGQHPLIDYAARLVPEESRLGGGTALELVAVNTGLLAWTRERPVEVRAYRNRSSEHYHPSWLTPSRVCAMTEAVVPPGGRATFRFETTPAYGKEPERFQLGFGDVLLPDTLFEVRPEWDPSLAIREVPVPLRPVILNQTSWDGGAGEGTGDDPYLTFRLGGLRHVTAVRVRFAYADAATRRHFHMYWRDSKREVFTETERFFWRDLLPESGERTLVVGVNAAIDELRIDPDNKPTAFRIAEVVLLGPDGSRPASGKEGSGRAAEAVIP
jgi:MoaA/NifB/PqqE/SkfB family radical SAM enzyme